MPVSENSYKSCGNCRIYDRCIYEKPCVVIDPFTFETIKQYHGWRPMPCPKCGGILSEVREHAGKKFRHCYACHFEFPIETLTPVR